MLNCYRLHPRTSPRSSSPPAHDDADCLWRHMIMAGWQRATHAPGSKLWLIHTSSTSALHPRSLGLTYTHHPSSNTVAQAATLPSPNYLIDCLLLRRLRRPSLRPTCSRPYVPTTAIEVATATARTTAGGLPSVNTSKLCLPSAGRLISRVSTISNMCNMRRGGDNSSSTLNYTETGSSVDGLWMGSPASPAAAGAGGPWW